MTPAARIQAAIDILDGLESSGLPADRFVREFFRARRYAGSKDRASITERVYDTFRHRAEFVWRMGGSESNRALVIGSLLREGLDADVVAALFSGDGYGPAALTEDERAAAFYPKHAEMPAHAQGEYPPFLQDELQRRFGSALLDEMRALTERAPVDLRVNTLKTERVDVLRELWESGFDAQATPFAPNGIRIAAGKGSATLQQSKLFQSGAFEFQDEAAQIAAALCNATPGQCVLDLAAGAGGKSLALAASMQNSGTIVACDVRRNALENLRTRATRAGATIIATKLVSELGPGETFDRVLVDAPCSGTGTWRRQPELRWRTSPERLDELNKVQNELLDQAARHVKPGGRLIYATCSILPRENEDRIAAFLARHQAFKPLSAHDIWAASARTAPFPPGMMETFRATPKETGTDGFFTAILAAPA